MSVKWDEQTVDAWWLLYAKRVIPETATHIQRTMMRQAFFAGAWSLLELLKALGAADDDALGDEVTKRLDAELGEWAATEVAKSIGEALGSFVPGPKSGGS